MKKVIALLLLVVALILTVGCEKNAEDDGYTSKSTDGSSSSSDENVSTGDNLVDFNDIDGGNGDTSTTTTDNADNGETTTGKEWTNIY